MNPQQKKAFGEASRRITNLLLELSEQDARFIEPTRTLFAAFVELNELAKHPITTQQTPELTKENSND